MEGHYDHRLWYIQGGPDGHKAHIPDPFDKSHADFDDDSSQDRGCTGEPFFTFESDQGTGTRNVHDDVHCAEIHPHSHRGD